MYFNIVIAIINIGIAKINIVESYVSWVLRGRGIEALTNHCIAERQSNQGVIKKPIKLTL